jgi:DNA-directed RNA polymerase subunit H (RpoH/RPB5)
MNENNYDQFENGYTRYKNVLEFIKKWQKFQTKHEEMKSDIFRAQMQISHYIHFECFDPKYEQIVNVLLFSENNIYVQNNADMKKLLSNIINVGKRRRIILITKNSLTIYHKKSIAKEIAKDNSIIIDAYRHEIFDFIVPLSNASAIHRILSKEEIDNITNHELFCNVVNLPKILDTDPQCVWIGAKPGDVLEIIMETEISGNCVRYHLVIPHTGRFTEKNISKELLQNTKAYMEKRKHLNPIEKKQKELISKREDMRGILVSHDLNESDESDDDHGVMQYDDSESEKSDDNDENKKQKDDNISEHSELEHSDRDESIYDDVDDDVDDDPESELDDMDL